MLKNDKLLDALRAFSSEDFLAAAARGERDFSKINFLREELRAVCGNREFLDCTEHPKGDSYNPLWVDYLHGVPGERDFHWDTYGRCLFDEEQDLPIARDLKGRKLSGVNLSGSYLYPIDFTDADLSKANLRRAIFIDCSLVGADLRKSDLRDALFYECDLTRANFYMARMDRTAISSCDARAANFERAKLYRSSLSHVDCRRAALARAQANLVNIINCDIRDVDLSQVTLPMGRISGSKITTAQVEQLLNCLGVEVL